jgi:hypothetical protein
LLRKEKKMDQWEYWTGFLFADIENDGAKDLLKKRWPNWKAPKHAPQTIMPELNAFGEKGWELVHMQPVPGLDKDNAVYFGAGNLASSTNSSVYFCVLKRRREK